MLVEVELVAAVLLADAVEVLLEVLAPAFAVPPFVVVLLAVLELEPFSCWVVVEFKFVVSCLVLAAVPFEFELVLLLFEFELLELDELESTDVVEALTAADAVATPARVAAAEAGGALAALADVSAEPAVVPITPAFDDDDVSFKCSLDADALLDEESTAPLPP